MAKKNYEYMLQEQFPVEAVIVADRTADPLELLLAEEEREQEEFDCANVNIKES